MRSAPLAADVKPVRPGLSGGQYRPLTKVQVLQIEQTIYQILDEIGLSQAPNSGVNYMTAFGARSGEDGRLRFSREVVDKALGLAEKDITLYGRDPKFDMCLSGTRVHYGTAGAAVHLVDLKNNEYRDSKLTDIYDAARIVQQMDNIHFFQRPMVARDISEPASLDLNTVYACIKGTSKHIGTSFTEAKFVGPCLSMLHEVAGGEAAWRERPFVSNSNCFVVPPLRFATESCLVMEEVVKAGMPVLLLSAGQAGGNCACFCYWGCGTGCCRSSGWACIC